MTVRHDVLSPEYVPLTLSYVMGIRTETKEDAEKIETILSRWGDLRQVVLLLEKGEAIGGLVLLKKLLEGTE